MGTANFFFGREGFPVFNFRCGPMEMNKVWQYVRLGNVEASYSGIESSTKSFFFEI